jgi:hypothetical protein
VSFDVVVYWITFEGEESASMVIPAGLTQDGGSFRGHVRSWPAMLRALACWVGCGGVGWLCVYLLVCLQTQTVSSEMLIVTLFLHSLSRACAALCGAVCPVVIEVPLYVLSTLVTNAFNSFHAPI